MRFAFTNSVWQQSTDQVHVRGNDLFGSQYQCKLPFKTQPPSEIAAAAFRSFKEQYSWGTKIRAVTVRAIELSPKDSTEQLTLFDNIQHRMTKEKVQNTVEEIRDCFGKSAITYASLFSVSGGGNSFQIMQYGGLLFNSAVAMFFRISK